MNKKELIGKYEYLNHDCFRRVDTSKVLRDLKQLDEPEKPVVPKFVANWIKYCKLTGVNLYHAFEMGDLYFCNYANQKDYLKLKEFFEVKENQETFARAWLDGYTIDDEKKYKITLLNRNDGDLYLVNQNANLGDKYGHFSPVVLLFTKSTFFQRSAINSRKRK